jgi:hypothetical protein
MSIAPRSIGFWAAAFLLSGVLLGGLGLAAAQFNSTEAEATAGTSDAAERDTTLTGRRIADLSFSEAQAEVSRVSSNADTLSSRVLQLLNDARAGGRATLALCYDDVLTQVNARRNTLADYVSAFNTSSSFDSTAQHNFTVVTVLGQALTGLERQANQCEGGELYDTGSTRVSVFIDPRTPTETVRTIAVPSSSSPAIPPPISSP